MMGLTTMLEAMGMTCTIHGINPNCSKETCGISFIGSNSTMQGTTPTPRVLAKNKFVNNTSRLRKWVCQCQVHVVNKDTGSKRKGPYIVRAAGDIAVRCNICSYDFQLEDTPATRRLYRGCAHCENPDAHTHGSIVVEEPIDDADWPEPEPPY